MSEDSFLVHSITLNFAMYIYMYIYIIYIFQVDCHSLTVLNISITPITPGTVIPFSFVPFHNRSAELFHSAFALYMMIVPIDSKNAKMCLFPKARDLHKYNFITCV